MSVRMQCVQMIQKIVEEKVFWSTLKNSVDEKNLAFANMLVLTALRHLTAIEQHLKKFLHKKIPEKNRILNYIFYAAVSEIVFMDTPLYAAINEYVEIAKHHSGKYSAAMVNAVLRKIAADRVFYEQKNFQPESFERILKKDYNQNEVSQILQCVKDETCLDISAKENPSDLAQKMNGVLFANGTIRLKANGMKIPALYGFEEGLWWVQDLAASLPVCLLKDVEGKKVLDLCAAPGGKTAQLLSRGAFVTAVDIDPQRMMRLQKNMERLKLSQNLKVEISDGSAYLEKHQNEFDVIVLDAPCSATGTFRRHPEVLYLKSYEDVLRQTTIQKKLLQQAAQSLKKNGNLLYCTCSISKDEGERIIEAFLQDHPSFKLCEAKISDLNKFEGKKLEQNIIDKGVLRTLPYHMSKDGGMDSFFAACLYKS